ncbi:MAG TPA: VWA domain-containing protein, partial [Vicinamibacterales bacterium]
MRLFAMLVVVGLGCGFFPQEAQTPRFRVAVDAVRIDAVVTDKDGNIVRDLTANDFEVLQDGKPQNVTFAQFVPLSVPATPNVSPPTLPASSVVAAPRVAAGPVRRETIQRTIALVVDDLGMSVESLYYVKRGLHDYIDHSLKPGDLVALVRTGGSIEGLQPFTTDRRVLHAAVDNLKWNTLSRSGVEAFAPVNEFTNLFDESHGQTDMKTGDFSAVDNLRNSMMAAGTLGALNLVIAGARELPGRKAVMFVSEGFQILEKDAGDSMAVSGRTRAALDRAVDRATRAGVVIYSIDARGLQTGGLVAADNFDCTTCSPQAVFESTVRARMQERNDLRRDTQEGMAYLAEQTGGFAVLNDNNLARGLTRASEDVRDYYVIGYAPAANTFATKGNAAKSHKIAVRVRRPGLRVRTRKQFLGISDVDETAAAETPAQQLVNAAISPFASTDITLRTMTLPGYDASRGLYVRTLLHIDASALTFAKDADGKTTASADVLGMVFDRDGTEVAHLSTGFSAALSNGATQTADGEALVYTLRIPIPRAGPYQVRFAVRDRATGKYGSAGEFVDLPDIAHGIFAISGITLRSAGDQATSADADRAVLLPSLAMRVFKPGTQLKYACEIYNAPAPVKLTVRVWRGTESVLTSGPTTLTPASGKSAAFAVGGA